MNDGRALKLFKWKSNPFTFNILPDLFVGYEKEAERIISGLRNEDKFSLLLGPTGSGKTTFLRYLTKKFEKNGHTFYLPKPPKKPEEWVDIFKKIVGQGFFSVFSGGKDVNLYNLPEYVNKKLKNEKCLLFVDEAHEASIPSLEWLRTITDQIDNLSIVIAGLPVFETILKENLETFMKRVSTKIELTNLTKSETRELIKRRIESTGGDDIKPFTSDTIDYIYDKTGGFPREILRFCGDLTKKALEKNISTVDPGFLRDVETPEDRISIESINSLPERQRLVLETISKLGEVTPSDIISNIKVDSYKNKDNAIRSVNNLLRRLMKDRLIERKRVGKTYKYSVSGPFQTLRVEK